MSTENSFSVIVPVLNAAGCIELTIPRVIDAVTAYGNADLIVVDNGSDDGSFEWLQRNLPDEVTLSQFEDAPVGAVRNYGARLAEGDLFCFVDADCVVEREHLYSAVRAFRESSAAAVGARYELPQEPSWVEETWHYLHRTGKRGYVDFLSGGNLIVDAEAFRAIDGFREDLETGEDAELCQRLRRNGYHIFHDPRITAVHLGNPKTLLGFFRKQRWYALGMFGTVGISSLDKPLAATLTYIFLLLLALVLIAIPTDLVVKVLGAGAAATFVPLISVLYRWAQIGRVVRPVRSLLLYELFFAARVAAALILLFRNTSGWRPEAGD